MTVLTMLAVWFVLSLPGCESGADLQAQRLFRERCSGCHPYSRAESRRYKEEDWRRTVYRMKDYNGASVTDEEAEIIIDYLARHHGL